MNKKQKSQLMNLISEEVNNTLNEVTASQSKTKKSPKAKKAQDPKESEANVVEMPAAKKAKVVKEVSAKQKDSIVEEVVSRREVKFLYPEDVTDTLAKKQWRQKTRNKYRALQREMNKFISDQKSKEFLAAKKEFEEYAASVLKPGQVI